MRSAGGRGIQWHRLAMNAFGFFRGEGERLNAPVGSAVQI